MTVNWIIRGDPTSGYDMSNEVTDGANNNPTPGVFKAYVQLGSAFEWTSRYLIVQVQYNNIMHIIIRDTQTVGIPGVILGSATSLSVARARNRRDHEPID